MARSLSPRDLALTLVVAAIWGFAFVPMKFALGEIPPFALAALRFIFAAFPAVFFIAPPAMPWRAVAAYGLAIGVAQFGLLFLGMKLGMAAGLSSIVIQTQVFFTIGLAVAFAGDRLSRVNIVGALVAGAGVAVLGGYKLAGGMTGTLIGFLCVVGAGFAWAVGNIIAKRSAAAHRADMFALVVWSSLAAPIPLAALSYVFEGGIGAWHAATSASLVTWAATVFMAWGATLFGFGTWNALLHRYPTALIQPFALLIPVSGLASGAIFLGETLAPMQFAGVALVFAGLVVNVVGTKRGA